MSQPSKPSPSAPARGPALGILEHSSIARGVVAIDAALKRAPAVLVVSRAISAGRHLACFEGGVAEVDEAMAAGRLAAAKLLLDDVELPYPDQQVWPMLAGLVEPASWAHDEGAEAVAIVETTTVCAAIRAADAAAKTADIVLRDVRLALDLAGKAYFSLTGLLPAVEAAAAAAAAAAVLGAPGPAGLVLVEVIAQPSPDLRGRIFR